MRIALALLPVLALIALGYGWGRRAGLDARGVALLNGFTVRLALPALLFRATAGGADGIAVPAGFTWAFAGGVAFAFALGLATAPGVPPGRAGSADRALAALTGAYANTAFVGVPLLGSLLGAIGTSAAVLGSLITVSGLFALAILLVELGLNAAAGPARAVLRALAATARNPLFAAPALGLAWSLTGRALPPLLDRPLALLAGAASPVALVTIGAFLALPGRRAPPLAVGHALAIKLLVQPAATAALVWLALPPLGLALAPRWGAAAVLLAALPTGTGPFMLAELHGRDAGLASRAILLSTLLGAATVAALAAWLT